jgi:hypothetical protein
MDARVWRFKVLAAVCSAVAVVAGVTNRAVAATQAPSAQASATSCLHPPLVYKLSRKATEQELYRILARHSGWLLKTYYIDLPAGDEYLDHVKPAYRDWRREARGHPEQANLCTAYLSYADLSGADLSYADLSGADLVGANLDSANLNGADLSGADLSRAHLNGADLSGANLSRADLIFKVSHTLDKVTQFLALMALMPHSSGANLYRADLSRADLSGADLSGADLSGADLIRANLSKAKLAYVDLTGATYAPASEPPDPYVAGIKGLATLNLASGEEIGLVQLRKLFQDAGLRDDERAATYSIERNVTRAQLLSSFWSFWWIEGVGRFVLFDLTTAYGMQPARALGLIVFLVGLLTLVYIWPIRYAPERPGKANGIYQVFPDNRIDQATAEPAVHEEPNVLRVQADDWWHAFWWAAYFSLLSAVNIGFEQFTPGDWIRRLQKREFSLEAVGWVRVVAGAQALLSVYLLAMWTLTQFGRPFE